MGESGLSPRLNAEAPLASTPAPASARPPFRGLYDAEVGYVGRVLVRFGVERRHLEDLIQEVFLVVHRRLADYDATRPIRPWLCGIAFRVASDWRRRAFQRELPTDIHDGHGESVTPTLFPASDRHLVAHQEVERGLAALSFDQRAVIVCCDLEGCSAKEAGDLLGLPVGTVYSRLHEARRLFIAAVRAARVQP